MKNIYIVAFLFLSIVIPNQQHSLLTKETYVTGKDGIIRMNVNIIGHVKNPGSHLVYDGIDFLSLISTAGGYLDGANLKNIIIYHSDGSNEVINLNKFYNSNISSKDLVFIKPNDTVYIEQKKISKIMRSSNLPSIFLSILNIALTIERTD